MRAQAVMKELKAMGHAGYKSLMMRNHGVREPCFGVKIGDMKQIQKRVKKDHPLALELYDTGNYDAMYLAGLIADDALMTAKDLQRWVERADGGALPEFTVAWVAAGSPHGWELALAWIDDAREHVARAGWATLSSVVALTPDEKLDLATLKKLIARVEKTITKQDGPLARAMNSFLIAAGCYVVPLTPLCLETAQRIGPVTGDLGNNACQIPSAADYIRKVEAKGSLGKKRKTVKC